MLDGLIAVIALAAVAQFLFAYAHFLLLSSSEWNVSDGIRQLMRPEVAAAPGDTADDFQRLMQLARVCPFSTGSELQNVVVRAYRLALKGLVAGSAEFVPRVAHWAQRELACSCHYAAVTLDQRVNLTRRQFEEVRG